MIPGFCGALRHKTLEFNHSFYKQSHPKIKLGMAYVLM
jgi:hypothetical protein